MRPTPPNRFKDRIARGETLQGGWLMSGSPTIAEAMGHTGIDYLVIDLEHSPTSIHGMLPLLQATDASGTIPVVRMPSHDRTAIKHALDLGANVLLFPFVQTAEDARAIVDACLYPPFGSRGISRINRASRYGAYSDYIQRASEDVVIIPQLETESAIFRTDEIVSVPGIAAAFVGPGDLAASIGLHGQTAHDRVKALMSDCAKRVNAHGKACGTVMGDPDLAFWAMQAGFRFVSIGNDIASVMSASTTQHAKLRQLRGE